jgi:hypothetical protein
LCEKVIVDIGMTWEVYGYESEVKKTPCQARSEIDQLGDSVPRDCSASGKLCLEAELEGLRAPRCGDMESRNLGGVETRFDFLALSELDVGSVYQRTWWNRSCLENRGYGLLDFSLGDSGSVSESRYLLLGERRFCVRLQRRLGRDKKKRKDASWSLSICILW